jgi:peptide/nickel transport system permease protein
MSMIWSYLFRRLLVFIPSLLVIMVLVFGLSRLLPEDPVAALAGLNNEDSTLDEQAREQAYRQKAAILGMDKPAFYVNFQPAAYPDTLYKIPFKERRKTLLALLDQSGNWLATEAYYRAVLGLKQALRQVPDTLAVEQKTQVIDVVNALLYHREKKQIQRQIRDLQALKIADSALKPYLGKEAADLINAHQCWLNEPQKGLLYLPSLRWQGFDNQFHDWLSKIISGNMGHSYLDSQPVFKKITQGLRWTLPLGLVSLLLSYLIGIPLGVKAARSRGSRFDRILNSSLFLLAALPSFWLAMVLLLVFTNPNWGLNFVSITALNNLSADATWGEWLDKALPNLLLPVLCISYPLLIINVMQMRSSMGQELDSEYVRTARAKGLPEKNVVWKHAFPNALFPQITLFANLLPQLIAGSVIVENIFNVPGMGNLLFESLGIQDWPVVFGILIFSALLTMLGVLIADLLYAWVDPRVNLGENKITV